MLPKNRCAALRRRDFFGFAEPGCPPHASGGGDGGELGGASLCGEKCSIAISVVAALCDACKRATSLRSCCSSAACSSRRPGGGEPDVKRSAAAAVGWVTTRAREFTRRRRPPCGARAASTCARNAGAETNIADRGSRDRSPDARHRSANGRDDVGADVMLSSEEAPRFEESAEISVHVALETKHCRCRESVPRARDAPGDGFRTSFRARIRCRRHA